MAITFPSNPSDGDIYSHGGVTYTWDASPGYWKGQFSVPTIPGDISDLTDTTNSLFDGVFSSLTGKPTTISGYGITDAFDGAFSSLTGKPTTLAGYGITDGGGGGFSGSYTAAATSAGTNQSTYTPNFTLQPGGICFVSEKGSSEGSVSIQVNGTNSGYAYTNTTSGNVTVRGRCTNGSSGQHKSIIFYAFNP